MDSARKAIDWFTPALCLYAAVATATVSAAPGLPADEGANLGVRVSQQQAARLSAVVMPDGTGLPAGGGTAKVGSDLYRIHCIACHGSAAHKGINDRLEGGQGSLASPHPVKTVGSYWPYATTVFDYVRRAMPYTAPGSLSNDQVYALTAYLLYANNIIAQDALVNAQTLPLVEMPNRHGFEFSTEVESLTPR